MKLCDYEVHVQTEENSRRQQAWLQFGVVVFEEVLANIAVRIVRLIVAPCAKHRWQDLPRLCKLQPFSYVMLLKINPEDD